MRAECKAESLSLSSACCLWQALVTSGASLLFQTFLHLGLFGCFFPHEQRVNRKKEKKKSLDLIPEEKHGKCNDSSSIKPCSMLAGRTAELQPVVLSDVHTGPSSPRSTPIYREVARTAAQPSGTKHFDRFSSTFHNNLGARYKPVRCSTFCGSLHILRFPIRRLLRIMKECFQEVMEDPMAKIYLHTSLRDKHHHLCSTFDYFFCQ